MKPFLAPEKSLGDLDAETVGWLISASADVALIIDSGGIITDLSFGSDDMAQEGYERWIGQPWVDTVTLESRPKIEAMLRDAGGRSSQRPRHVNHMSNSGIDVPVLYSALKVGQNGRAVAVGRDLRAMAVLQQRLLDAQQAMERDYWRLRHVETRYRLMFQMTAEPIVIVDAATLKVVEANPAATEALGEATRKLTGRPFLENFDADSGLALNQLLGKVRGAGRGGEADVRTSDGSRSFVASASLVRQETGSLYLVRLADPNAHNPSGTTARSNSALFKVIENAPDGFVVTDMAGRVLMANPAFLNLAQLSGEDEARGESLDQWVGRPGVDLNVLIANLRQHGSVRLYSSTLNGAYGSAADIEISAVSVPHGDPPCLGFTIRDIGRRLSSDAKPKKHLPRSVEQLTELIGKVSMKDLVRDATDLIEKLCIEAALEMTRDNRASAAEMLGLSRQSLYVKLRRYGLAEIAAETDEES